MADLTVSAFIDTYMGSADAAAARSNLGLTALSTTTPGTGVATALAVNVGSAGAFVILNGVGGTPSSITLTNGTGLPVASGISGLGTGVATALAVNTGSAGAFVVLNGAGGTPSAITLTNGTGLPISTGVSGMGTGVATFLATPSGANLASALTTALPASKGGTGLTALGTNVTTLLGTDLTDPNADRLLFWDDSAGAFAYLTAGTGLSISGTTITATGGAGGISGPGTTTDNAIVLWNSLDGTVVQDSPITVDPVTGDMANIGEISGDAVSVNALVISGNTISGVTGTGDMMLNDSPVVGTQITPGTNDGSSLGTTALQWSDLHLATGALINFNNGNAVITHSSAVLTVSTGDLRVTTAGTNSASCVTVGGTQTLTNKTLTSPTLTTPALGTPASGTLTNCTGLPASGIAAGVLGGNVTLGESTGQIVLDAALSADGTWSGIMVAGTAGTTLAFGDLIYLAAADSRWELADADAASTSGDVVLGICVLAAAADGNATNVLLYGKVRADAAFPALTIGAPAYAGTTAGDIQTAQPSGTDDVIRVVGFGLTADELFFNPAGSYITHT